MKRRIIRAICALPIGCALLLGASCGGPAPSDPGLFQEDPLPIVEDLLPVEDFSDPRAGDVTHIVVHFMSAVKSRPDAPYDWPSVRRTLEDAGVSAHYAIQRDGTIRRLIPENRVAWHAGKGSWQGDERYTNQMNRYSIGIELLGIGTGEEMAAYLTPEEYAAIPSNLLGFTDEQYASLWLLIEEIRARHPGVTADRAHILGHAEYAPRKSDPGALFDWSRLGL